MSPGPKGHPTRLPKEPECRRLEQVRAYFDVRSVRAFWKRLADGWEEEAAPSYESARAYHDDRVPPAAYMARVSDVFGVNLRWLVTGAGEMLEDPVGEPTVDSQLGDSWLREHLPLEAKRAVVDFLWEVYRSDAPHYAVEVGPSWEELPEGTKDDPIPLSEAKEAGIRRFGKLRRRVSELLRSPFDGASIEGLSDPEVVSYVQHQVASWRMLLRAPEKE